jgi:hypothetical protein
MFSYSFGFDAQMVDAAYPAYIKETLPKSQLGYGTNNVYPQFPPKMQDARSVISSWNAESVLDKQYKVKYGEEFLQSAPLNPNWMYRRYLQKNAYEVMAQNFQETANDTGSAIPLENRQAPSQTDKNMPFFYGSLSETTEPAGYESSDLKSLYLTREQLNARKFAPTVN